ncbi:MAG: hypothetical protein V2I76_07805 [Roseobacter sp.]|jgi:hypothetical protein|nr:hypothetical protein [Roseobacter sp.]
MANNRFYALVNVFCLHRTIIKALCLGGLLSVLFACSQPPLRPFAIDAAPMDQTPKSLIGVTDDRARFREIYCEVLETRNLEQPDYRPCDVALTRVADEKPGLGQAVPLGQSYKRLKVFFVPGIGWDCFSEWLAPAATAVDHIESLGYDFELVPIEGLSSSGRNARIIRDTVLQSLNDAGDARAILVGYSKGSPDVLQAVTTYPELRTHVAAVVSIAGAVWGSPLANNAKQSHLTPLRNWPGATCSAGDGGALDSLTPQTRNEWMAENPLPSEIRYYSLVALPDRQNISAILKPGFAHLAKSDPRNDSQLMLFDQFVPGSKFLAYLNADHWAVALPIAQSRPFIGNTFVNRNAYPREALLEAILRSIEEDLYE